jgi:hypothetical protein
VVQQSEQECRWRRWVLRSQGMHAHVAGKMGAGEGAEQRMV